MCIKPPIGEKKKVLTVLDNHFAPASMITFLTLCQRLQSNLLFQALPVIQATNTRRTPPPMQRRDIP